MGGNVIYQYNTKTKTIILGGTYYNVSGKGVDSGDTNPEVIYAEIGNIEIHGGTFRVKSNETTHESPRSPLLSQPRLPEPENRGNDPFRFA